MSHAHNKTTVRANRTGPNNAGQIEDAFVEEIQRRFRRIRGLVRTTVGYTNDALGLSANDAGGLVVQNGKIYTQVIAVTPNDETEYIRTKVPKQHYKRFHASFGQGLRANAEPREAFDFPSRTGLTSAFIRWLKDAIRDEILGPANPIEVEEGQHWTSQFIREAFIRGVNQSTGLLFQQGVSLENIPDDEITKRPIFGRTLRDLYQRTYSNLESVTNDTAPQVRDILTRGFAEGWGPRKMADELTAEIRDIQHTRAETLARSETINAHSSAALDNYERAGVNVVNHVRWSAADDTRTCPFCRRLDGTELTLEEMRTGSVQWRGQIYRLQPPAHPNGRCVPRPSVGGDRPTETLHSRLDESFEAFTLLSGS